MKNKLNFENNLLNWIPQFLFIGSTLYGLLQFILKGDYLFVLLWFFIGLLLFTVSQTSILLISTAVGYYSPLGYLYKWYDRTLKLMDVEWITDVWRSMCKLGLVDKNIVNFISPSGNKGVYEKTLFNNIVTHENKINFIVSDKLKLKNHEESISCHNSNFIYVPGKDAFDIQKTINQCNLKNVNVIWDFKGMVWYSVHKFNNKHNKTLQVFQNYYNSLTADGIIVIDNIYVNPKFEHINTLLNIIFKFRIGLGEISTSQKLDSVLLNKKAENIKNYLELNFDKYDIKYTDKNIVRVYKKRA